MLARSELYIRWLLYAAATVLLLFFQGVVQDLRLLGVLPFLYPALAAVVGMFEGAFAGSVYGLVLGIVCDELLPGSFFCLYTLTFPPAAALAGIMAGSWLPVGFPCALLSSALGLAVVDVFRFAQLLAAGELCGAAVRVALLELCATLVFLPVVYLVLRWVHRKCEYDN